MRTIALALAALVGLPAIARAAPVEIRINLPEILPPLVVIQPGVQVVPRVQEEVFFVDGWYFVRRGGEWYRSRDHRGGWALVPPPAVPQPIVTIPPGRYRNWKEEKEAAKAERKAEKRREKAERKHDRGHDDDHGHGRGHGKH